MSETSPTKEVHRVCLHMTYLRALIGKRIVNRSAGGAPQDEKRLCKLRACLCKIRRIDKMIDALYIVWVDNIWVFEISFSSAIMISTAIPPSSIISTALIHVRWDLPTYCCTSMSKMLIVDLEYLVFAYFV